MRFSVALICMMVVASGCGPSEREVATEKLLSAKYKDIKADYIRVLISEGADVNARRTDGGTPLMIAASNSNPEIVRLLIEKGAELEARDTAGSIRGRGPATGLSRWRRRACPHRSLASR